MSYDTIRVTQADGVATITLARPERLNALTAAMHADLRAALDRLAGDDAVRVVVLTGEGRAFSSGQDLTEDLPRDDDGKIDLGPPLARDYNPLILRLADYPKLTVAALNGPAVGASANIALACDIVLAAKSSFIQQAFAKIALIPDAGGSWILPRLVGPKRALALMLTADPVPAEEAQRMGLVYRVFEDEAFETQTRGLRRSARERPGHGAAPDEAGRPRKPRQRSSGPARSRGEAAGRMRSQRRLRGGRRRLPREAKTRVQGAVTPLNYPRWKRATRLDVSQRLPPIFWTSA